LQIKNFETYLPHWHFVVAEEKDVNLPWHLTGLFQVNIVVEEELNTRDLAELLELVFVRDVAHFGLLNLAVFLLSEGWALVVPELPGGVQRMGFGGDGSVSSGVKLFRLGHFRLVL